MSLLRFELRTSGSLRFRSKRDAILMNYNHIRPALWPGWAIGSFNKFSNQTYLNITPNRLSKLFKETATQRHMVKKRLYRNTKNKAIAGVCSGIANYFEVDPLLVRLMWVFLTLISVGAGVLAYIIAWIVIPKKK